MAWIQKTIAWNGDTYGRPYIENLGLYNMYKVSSDIVDPNSIVNLNGRQSERHKQQYGSIFPVSRFSVIYVEAGIAILVDVVADIVVAAVVNEDVIFHDKRVASGIYFANDNINNGMITLSLTYNFKEIEHKGLAYQDIHLSDKERWNDVQTYWKNNAYANMFTKLQDVEFAQKVINSDMFGDICDYILELENQYFDDDDFKADRIQVSATPPTGLTVGQVYFKLD